MFAPLTVSVSTLMVFTPEPKLKVKVLEDVTASIKRVVPTIVLVVASLTVSPDPVPPGVPVPLTSAPILNVPVPRYIVRLAKALMSQFT